jgi:hypothetical protein
MSTWSEYAIGTTKVPIELTLNGDDGGVIGENPQIKIRRVTDNFYLDFSDNVFKASGHAAPIVILSSRGDGRYSYSWDSSKSVKTPTTVVVEYSTVNPTTVPGIDNDVISFSNSATILENLAKTSLANVGDGPGSCRFVYTLTLSPSGSPIADALVYVTTDVEGTKIIAGPKPTDLNGKVIFFLTIGETYYLWRSKGGVKFANPDVETLT